MNSRSFYCHYIPPPKTSEEEWQKAFAEFQAKGGKVQQMKSDNGNYDKGLKKTQENLSGGFNPFSKDFCLTINKEDFNKR
jgi:hypothetical protein